MGPQYCGEPRRSIALNPHRRYRLSADVRDEHWDLRTTYFGRPGELEDRRRAENQLRLDFEPDSIDEQFWNVQIALLTCPCQPVKENADCDARSSAGPFVSAAIPKRAVK
jgi:hypothetical protein